MLGKSGFSSSGSVEISRGGNQVPPDREGHVGPEAATGGEGPLRSPARSPTWRTREVEVAKPKVARKQKRCSLIIRKTNGRTQEEGTYPQGATRALERVSSMEREELLISMLEASSPNETSTADQRG